MENGIKKRSMQNEKNKLTKKKRECYHALVFVDGCAVKL